MKEVYFNNYCPKCVNYKSDDIESVCNECLTNSAREDSHKPIHFEQSFKVSKNKIIKPVFIKDYLYSYDCTDLNYNTAFKYFKERGDFLGQCSVVRNGNFVGRQLDWYYDSNAEFIVKVPRNSMHYASIGICGGLSELNNNFVKSGEWSPMYDILPFHMYDGINEWGVFANINVVPMDYGRNHTIPYSQKHYELSSLMLIRFILDNFRSAFEAVNYIQDHCSVFFPEALHNMGYEAHFMVADRRHTYVMEFVGNRTVVITEHPIMTNFHISNVIFNADGTVMTPETGDAMDVNGITKYGSGLERYNLIVNNYDSCGTAEGMKEMCNKLMYSQTYLSADKVSDPFWYTEYVGGNNTVSSPVEQLRATAERFSDIYTNRVRDDHTTWQSTHSVVYDLENKSLSVVVQEDGEELTFSLA